MAVLTSLFFASCYVGSAIGACVSGAIWTQVLPSNISKQFLNIGIDSEAFVVYAYGSPFQFIAEYLWGTSERMAVVEAYKHVQKLILTCGTCLCVPLIAFALLLRNQKLLDVQNLYDDPNIFIKTENETGNENEKGEKVVVHTTEKPKSFWSSKLGWIFR